MSDEARHASLKAFVAANPVREPIPDELRGEVAAPEAGHAVVAHALGVAVRGIRLTHSSRSAATAIDPSIDDTASLAVTAAGQVGEYLLAYKSTWRMSGGFAPRPGPVPLVVGASPGV